MPVITLNLTRNLSTPEQIAEGFVDMSENMRADLLDLLTVQDNADIQKQCFEIAQLAKTWYFQNSNGNDSYPIFAYIKCSDSLNSLSISVMNELKKALEDVNIFADLSD